jgi:hypothetical protein
MDDFFRSARNYVKLGAWGALILSILLAALVYFLQKASFICLDPKYCSNLSRRLIEAP